MLRRFALPAILLLGACGERQQEEPAESVAEPVASTPASAALDIELLPAGLVMAGAAEPVDIPFGTLRAEVERLVAPQLGDPVLRSANDECPAGPLDFSEYQGLSLVFQSGQLVGWLADGPPFLPGQNRAELGEIATPVVDSSLGEEFLIGTEEDGQVSGLFESDAPDAQVATLWAGTNCIFR